MHTYIRLEAQAGARIENAIAEARDHSRRLDIEVKLYFNEAWVHIKPSDNRTITEILDEYNQQDGCRSAHAPQAPLNSFAPPTTTTAGSVITTTQQRSSTCAVSL